MIRWIGFILALTILLLGAKRNLNLAMLVASVIIGIFALEPRGIVTQIYNTLIDPSVILLALALTMIPVLGGMLSVSGKLDDVVQNLRIGKRAFLGLSPALLGLMPIPGGALLSSPLVEGAGDGVSSHLKAAINVWFRHVLYFIYPLSYALLVAAAAANISLYTAILYLSPFFFLSLVLGHFFLLKKVQGELEYTGEVSLKKMMIPLSILITAPVLHLVLSLAFEFPYDEIPTFIAVSFALAGAILITESKMECFKKSVKKMKPWNFTFLIINIFIFINIFKASGIDDMISDLALPLLILAIPGGFFLGISTGRIMLPSAILFPIMMTSMGTDAVPPYLFVITYVAIFLGYAITPVHPCIALSLEYFKADLFKYLKELAWPIIIMLAMGVMIYFIFA